MRVGDPAVVMKLVRDTLDGVVCAGLCAEPFDTFVCGALSSRPAMMHSSLCIARELFRPLPCSSCVTVSVSVEGKAT